MNYVKKPVHDDFAALFDFVRNYRLKFFTTLMAAQSDVIGAYINYLKHSGNARSINPVGLDDVTAAAFEFYYASPPKELAFIDELRDTNAHKVCAMCGSMGSETLDHVLPRTTYPEFSVFIANLVPACPCNSKRSDVVKGALEGERVLHPYFDECLGDRLLAAKIAEPFGDAPRISLEVQMDGAHPLRPAVDFHILNVVARTAVLGHLDARWAALWRKPALVLPRLDGAVTPIDAVILENIVAVELTRLDELHCSKNNWDSIFVAGLRAKPVIEWLVDHVNAGEPGLK